jgi:hypothetical protein
MSDDVLKADGKAMGRDIRDHNDPIDTTGLPSLDDSLSGILAGDNIVWHVDRIQDYQSFVKPYVQAAVRDGRKLVYFRFARHEPLLPEDFPCERHTLNPEDGFEAFIHRIHQVIGEAGFGAYYVFDCLSDLATDWYSDAMLGNFFMLTCPYLYKLETIAYFGLLRRHHSRHATEPVQSTTQLFIDVFHANGKLYVRPVKTQFRYTSTIHLLHVWKEQDAFEVVRSSAVIAEVLSNAGPDWVADEMYGEEVLHRAEEITSHAGEPGFSYSDDQKHEVWRQLVRMVVTRDDAIMPLVQKYLTISDLLDIRGRMVGTGLIGGKTVGMLVARKIVASDAPQVAAKLEPHDSFYIGADVFYTFLVRNGLWPSREQQHSPETFLEGVDEAREKILAGTFPDYVLRQFEEMLDYFGQYPVIVRSSSLLEDNYGNAFAGKYESVFCANQGTREARMASFLEAVLTVYASTMSREALNYRARHKLLERDEQMALLVMRVTGVLQSHTFYPHLAGVGFSYNPFVWSKEIDPEAGVVRLVYGLGTRAVDRVDDDYTRVVALNAPLRRPEPDFLEVCRHSQRKVDFIDLEADALRSGYFEDLLKDARDVPIDLFTSFDQQALMQGRVNRILTFDRLLTETSFVPDMRQLFKSLETAYERPVDVEFAVNFLDDQAYRINLLQCRPLQVQGTHNPNVPEIRVAPEDALLMSKGAVVGHSRVTRLDWILYVHPELYGALEENTRHAVARAIGEINRALGKLGGTVLAVAPGRWGTHMASLGVPVNFSEINHVAALCEVAQMHAFLTPDISLGTHFFGELVELNMLYFALFPDRPENRLNRALIERARDCLSELVPGLPDNVAPILRVIRADEIEPEGLWLVANAPEQEVFVARRN